MNEKGKKVKVKNFMDLEKISSGKSKGIKYDLNEDKKKQDHIIEFIADLYADINGLSNKNTEECQLFFSEQTQEIKNKMDSHDKGNSVFKKISSILNESNTIAKKEKLLSYLPKISEEYLKKYAESQKLKNEIDRITVLLDIQRHKNENKCADLANVQLTILALQQYRGRVASHQVGKELDRVKTDYSHGFIIAKASQARNRNLNDRTAQEILFQYEKSDKSVEAFRTIVSEANINKIRDKLSKELGIKPGFFSKGAPIRGELKTILDNAKQMLKNAQIEQSIQNN